MLTLSEFRRDNNSIQDLIDFCYENDMNTLEDIYSQDDFDSYVEEEYIDTSSYSWREIFNKLEDLPRNSYDFYRRDGWGDWEGFDDEQEEFEAYLDTVESAALELGIIVDDFTDCDDDDEWFDAFKPQDNSLQNEEELQTPEKINESILALGEMLDDCTDMFVSVGKK